MDMKILCKLETEQTLPCEELTFRKRTDGVGFSFQLEGQVHFHAAGAWVQPFTHSRSQFAKVNE